MYFGYIQTFKKTIFKQASMSTNENTESTNHPYAQDVDQDKLLIIGKNFTAIGDLMGQGTVVVVGRLEGNMITTKAIIAAGSTVLGNLTCVQSDISGYVKGTIEAANVIIRKGAKIEGEINYSTLAMEQGSDVLGKLKKISPKPQTTQGPALTSYEARTEKPKLTETFALDIHPEWKQKLASDPISRADTRLEQNDGTPAPAWITLTADKCGIVVASEEFKALVAQGKSFKLRLTNGSDCFDFNLPA